MRHSYSAAENLSAARLLSEGQIVLALLVCVPAFAISVGSVIGYGWRPLLTILVTLVTLFYVLFVGFKFVISMAASSHDKVAAFYDSLPLLPADKLRHYVAFLLLVHEPEETVRQLIAAAEQIDYPKHKLHVMLVVEQHDIATCAIVRAMKLPPHFEIIEVPDEGPRTKPKAFNYAWSIAMQRPELEDGFGVIFDAEDRMHAGQLRRAATVFRWLSSRYAKRPVGCLQGRLAFWNPRGSKTHRSNWIPTFSWAEYSVHFYRMLPGMARLGLVPPLGGTSNHFRMDMLARIARRKGGWRFERPDGTIVVHQGPMDPYCLTEDSLLAADIYCEGYRVDLINSVTYEEAPQYALAATKQRERWNFGWLQSGLVQLRHPVRTMRRMGPMRWFCYNLLMLGTPFSLVVNPPMWALTATYFIAKAVGAVAITSFIQSLYMGPVFYLAVLVMVAGNLVLWYQKLLTPLRRQERAEAIPTGTPLHPLQEYQQTQEYGMVIRLVPTPLWWGFTSVAGWRALIKACRPASWHVWGNTRHGNAAELESVLLASPTVKQLSADTTPPSLRSLTDTQRLPEEA